MVLVKLTVGDLGLGRPSGYTIDQIYQRADELGLDLCPAEVGPHLRLQYQDQPKYEHLHVCMKLIADSIGNLSVFRLDRFEDGLSLHGSYALGSRLWGRGDWFVFRLRKPSIPSDGGV